MSKPTLWVTILLCMSSSLSMGQGINDQLRTLFSEIEPPPLPAPFFFDMSAHEIDDNWFTPVNMKDTTCPHIWWTLYYEMRQSAFRTEIMPETFGLRENARALIARDTIPIGILDLEYCRLKENAFDSSVFFTWTDSILHRSANAHTHPYAINMTHLEQGTSFVAFSAVPLFGESEFRDVTFVIDPDFVFYGGPFNSFTKPEPYHIIKINFGDGAGWRTFDPSKKSCFDVTYPGSGLFKVEVQVLSDAPVRYAQSVFYVRSDQVSIEPDEIIDTIPGLVAGVYYGCDEHKLLDKVLIVVSGFDMYESNSVPMFYDHLVNESRLIMLRNYGYDIICVEWEDSKADLVLNGDRLIELLEYLKCRVLNIENNFTILGASMGALLSNYALTKMETPEYQRMARSDPRICYPEQMHNTRTFISTEGEYQGAFINIGAQMYTDILKHERAVGKFPSYTVASTVVDGAYFRDRILARKGVKQMLMLHIDSTDGQGRFYPHAERIAFLKRMQDMGDHPQYVKTIALSSALANGDRQVALGNKRAKPGDTYYDLTLNFSLRVLGKLRLPIDFHSQLNGHPGSVLPSGSEKPVLSYYLSYPKKLNLKGCLRKLMSAGTCNSCPCVLFYNNDQLLKLAPGIPWDVLAGGRVSTASALFNDTGDNVRSVRGISRLHPFGFFSYALVTDATTGSGRAIGTYRIGGYIRFGHRTPVPVMLPLVDANLDIYSEMESFNFVPWASAYDYRNPDSLSQDLINTDIKTIFDHSDFDVLIGRLPHEDFPLSFPEPNEGQKHFEHREMRTGHVDDHPELTILTREIGEAYMHLDNLVINRRSLFEAERRINAGSNAHPGYRTVHQNGPGMYKAIWSRSDGVRVTAHGMAVFNAGKEIRLQPGFEVAGGGALLARIKPMQVCKYSLAELRKQDELKQTQNKDTVSSVRYDGKNIEQPVIYPNPFRADLQFHTEKKGWYVISDATGMMILTGTFTKGTVVIETSELGQGMYFIELFKGETCSVFKLYKIGS